MKEKYSVSRRSVVAFLLAAAMAGLLAAMRAMPAFADVAQEYTGRVVEMTPEKVVLQGKGDALEIARESAPGDAFRKVKLGDEVIIQYIIKIEKISITRERAGVAGPREQKQILDDRAFYGA